MAQSDIGKFKSEQYPVLGFLYACYATSEGSAFIQHADHFMEVYGLSDAVKEIVRAVARTPTAADAEKILAILAKELIDSPSQVW